MLHVIVVLCYTVIHSFHCVTILLLQQFNVSLPYHFVCATIYYYITFTHQNFATDKVVLSIKISLCSPYHRLLLFTSLIMIR